MPVFICFCPKLYKRILKVLFSITRGRETRQARAGRFRMCVEGRGQAESWRGLSVAAGGDAEGREGPPGQGPHPGAWAGDCGRSELGTRAPPMTAGERAAGRGPGEPHGQQPGVGDLPRQGEDCRSESGARHVLSGSSCSTSVVAAKRQTSITRNLTEKKIK